MGSQILGARRWIRQGLLTAVILAYLLLGAIYSISLPIFEAPDEALHYSYTRYLATEHRLPPWGAKSPAEHESSQPPLYYATAALTIAWMGQGPAASLQPNPYYDNYQPTGTVNDNKNVFIHSRAEAYPWRGEVLAVHLTRLVNLLFGSITVGATYLLAREIFRESSTMAVGAAALVAFNPQFLFISAAVNNDAAAAAFSTLTLWLIARGLKHGYTLRRAAVLGVTVGLAALSKVSTLGLLALAVPPIALALWQRRRWSEICRSGAVTLTLAAVIAGWWYVRSAVLHGAPFGLNLHFETWWAYEEPLSIRQLWTQLSGVEQSFWAAFGMGNIRLANVFYVILRIVARLGIVGLLVWAARSWKAGRRPGPRAWSLGLLALWVAVVVTALLRWMRVIEAPLGRLLFPAIGAIAVLLAWGLARLVPRRFAAWPGLTLAGFLFAAASLSPLAAISPAYARPPLLSEDQIAARTRPADLRFSQGIRLVGYELEDTSAHPGEEIAVTLCWKARAPLTEDYAYFIHLLGPREQIVGGRDTYPGLGRFPTSQWVPGDAFCDAIHVPIEEWTPVPAVYHVEVGWYEPVTGRRLTARSSAGAPLGMAVIDRVGITPERRPVIEIPHRVNADLNGEITLLGYDVSEREAAPGQVISLTLYWKAQAPVSADYTVFVHLADPAGLLPYAQGDGQPRDGSYPTSFWSAGETVIDTHDIIIPGDTPPGEYSLLVGMYLLETGQRLPAFDAQGTQLPADAVPLGTVRVRSEGGQEEP
ncbi:MAG: glycosyltransferase family 39 protein [Anaerolineae bacterium]